MARRPRILFVWELGANLGHASKIAEVARALAGRAEIAIAAQQPDAVAEMTKGLDVRIGPAPFVPYKPPARPEDLGLGYSDNLAHQGWGDVATLQRLVEDWRALFVREVPDLLVTQSAPTALLAARTMSDLSTAILGSGFDFPPRAAPMPRFFHWLPDPEGRFAKLMVHREAVVLATANEVLAAFETAPMKAVSDVLQADGAYLTTLPETDQYAPRKSFEPDHPEFMGLLFTMDQGVVREWRKERSGKRIFAYLRGAQPEAQPAFAAFEKLAGAHDIILSAPGIEAQIAARLEKAGVLVEREPVRLAPLLPEADLGVSHASNGTVAAFLHHGVPQLGLPTQGEQVMVANTLVRAKLGLALGGAVEEQHVIRGLERLGAATDIAKEVTDAAARIKSNPAYRNTAGAIAEGMLKQIR